MNRLKFHRLEANLSQYELAQASGMPRWRIQLLEAGNAHPTEREATTLADLMGVKETALFPKYEYSSKERRDSVTPQSLV